MKLAVILAIIQMSMGIVMKGLNSIYFKSMLDFFFEFIPQIVLLLALFGWMDALIIAKWMYPRNPEIYVKEDFSNDAYTSIRLAPSIITTMIDIFLNGASNEDSSSTTQPLKYLYVISG